MSYTSVPKADLEVGVRTTTTALVIKNDADTVVADYDYQPSTQNACLCRGASRMVGRINVMKEEPIPPGQQHPRYPGLQTRIVWVIPSGWPMLFISFGGIIGIPIAMLCGISPIVATYGSPVVVLSMIAAAICLCRVTFKDPGIFPRYRAPQGANWALCQKTNSYRYVRWL